MAESHTLQDQESSAEAAKVQHARLARKVASLLQDASGLGARLAHAAPEDQANCLEHIDVGLSSYFAHSYELGQRLKRQKFSVAVLALAKSGNKTVRERWLLRSIHAYAYLNACP
jgi:ribosomal protein L30E